MTGKEKEIRAALVKQLELRKADTPFFIAQVDEYMYLGERVRQMKVEIRKSGLCSQKEYNNSGKTAIIVSPLLKEIRETNKQMLSILEKLKLTTDNVIAEGDEEM